MLVLLAKVVVVAQVLNLQPALFVMVEVSKMLGMDHMLPKKFVGDVVAMVKSSEALVSHAQVKVLSLIKLENQ